jgi:hypothetical protein
MIFRISRLPLLLLRYGPMLSLTLVNGSSAMAPEFLSIGADGGAADGGSDAA